MPPDIVVSLFSSVIVAAGMYGAMKGGIEKAITMAVNAAKDADSAHRRIDDILKVTK